MLYIDSTGRLKARICKAKDLRSQMQELKGWVAQ